MDGKSDVRNVAPPVRRAAACGAAACGVGALVAGAVMPATTAAHIEIRARRAWLLTAAVVVAHVLPSRVGFALARIVARFGVVVEFRMSSRDRWRRAPLHEQIG